MVPRVFKLHFMDKFKQRKSAFLIKLGKIHRIVHKKISLVILLNALNQQNIPRVSCNTFYNYNPRAFRDFYN